MTVSMTKMIRIGMGMGTTKICENPVIITSIFIVVIFTLMIVVVVFATSFSFPTIFLIITIIFNITCSVCFPWVFSRFLPTLRSTSTGWMAPRTSTSHGKIRNAENCHWVSPTKFRLIFDVGDPCRSRDVARDAWQKSRLDGWKFSKKKMYYHPGSDDNPSWVGNTHPYKSSVTYTRLYLSVNFESNKYILCF